MTAIPFPLRSDPASVKFLGEPRCINCYAEEIGPDKRTPVAMLAIPGQTQFANPTDVPSRGYIYVEELSAMYSVHGPAVFKINSAGTATELDGVVPGSSPVIMERGAQHYRSGTVTISAASPAVVTWIGHRLTADTTFRFSTTGELPTGIDSETTYYVIATGLSPNTFQFSTSQGGSAVNTSGDQTGTHTVTRTVATYQIAIVSDYGSYCIEDDLIYHIILPEEASSVTFLGNRFVFGADGGKCYFSALNDCTSVGSLDFFTAEARPDGLKRAHADRGELWLLGNLTTEIWRETGDSELPFAPLGGSFIDKGTASKMSVVSFDNAVHWVGHDGIVYRGAGYVATRMSTHAVERAISALSDKTTIRAYVDTYNGHTFLVLTCADWTWVYDAATKLWHERKSYQRDDWKAWPYVSAFGKRLVGDKASGKVMQLDEATYSENTAPIRAELILPDIPGPGIFKRLEIDLGTGVGLNVAATADGYDPQVMVQWSDDGGNTWSSERWQSIGRQGQYDKRVCFYRLGAARTVRGRRFRIAVSDNVQKSFALGDIDLEPIAA